MPTAKKEAKKLVLVLAASASLIDVSKETPKIIQNWVPYIHYSVQFRKDKEIIRALINFDSEINTMTLAYAKKLGLQIQKTDVRV